MVLCGKTGLRQALKYPQQDHYEIEEVISSVSLLISLICSPLVIVRLCTSSSVWIPIPRCRNIRELYVPNCGRARPNDDVRTCKGLVDAFLPSSGRTKDFPLHKFYSSASGLSHRCKKSMSSAQNALQTKAHRIRLSTLVSEHDHCFPVSVVAF
ncbi:hypothetical protein FRB95_001818 [Tulasnella sp. JGI-2019a]|nr:hypothetical protein FRB95_001818 [Tulasnella sp. JGI-2019a]